MLRISLLAACSAILCFDASAQQRMGVRKMPTPLRDAGVYHVATGTWTRGGSMASVGPDAIYSATQP